MDRFWPDRRGGRTGGNIRLRAEQGLTIVEVMVAAMILVLGALAIFKIVDAATRTSYRAEQSQVVSNLLQRELERVKSLDPSEMVVQSESVETCLSERASAAEEGAAGPVDIALIDSTRVIKAPGAPMVPCEQMAISPGEGDDSSDVGVTVFRFVTWFDPDFDESCEPPDSADDDATNVCGMRRITIGAKPSNTGPGGERAYKEIQSDVVNALGDTG